MKKIYSFLVCCFLVGIMAACSEEGPVNEGDKNKGNEVFVNVNLALPSSGSVKSTTNDNGGSSGGVEIGLDDENKVNEVALILATKDNKFGAYSLVTGLSSSNSSIRTTASFDLTAISNFYVGGNTNLKQEADTINVYVFCNPTQALKEYIGGLSYGNYWIDKVSEDADLIWESGKFLMSNAKPAPKKLPSTFDSWKIYNSETSAFDLSGNNNGGVSNEGSIKVERSAARLDFKDGSPAETPANTYNIGKGEDAGLLKMQLVRMSLVNMSKEFYYLRRVSNDGTNTNWQISGTETSSNYVVDNDYAFKANTSLNPSELFNHFNYPLTDIDGKITSESRKNWDNYWIEDITSNKEDHPDYTKADYHIWRYVTENTVPGDVANQRMGISTGVVFKGKLLADAGLAAEDKNPDLYNAINGTYNLPEGVKGYVYTAPGANNDNVYPILYSFQNNLYVGWNAGVKKMADSDETKASDIYKACYDIQEGQTKSPNDLYQELVEASDADKEIALAAFRKAATAAGFTLYQASNDGIDNPQDSYDAGTGYYCYYYYWNRHNDNENAATMGKMEFATVRNNVYKLAVTSISKLGHPRISDNDPDPVDPDNPDENGEVHMIVSVEVLPWVVRENNIEF